MHEISSILAKVHERKKVEERCCRLWPGTDPGGRMRGCNTIYNRNSSLCIKIFNAGKFIQLMRSIDFVQGSTSHGIAYRY